MTLASRWLLPEGIEEILPPAARQLEQLRRALLDLYSSWGYELVIPPLIEFLESLLTGTGNDLELQTFKLTDQLSGRMMGVRADMTPQVARIDAHHLRRDVPTRLCYMGTVLHTRNDGFGGSRSPFQVGAELYGHLGLESDLEVLGLMLETLAVAGVETVHLDLGHVVIFRALVAQAALDADREQALFDALQRKALPEIREQMAESALPDSQQAMLLALAELNGGEDVLDVARQRLRRATDEVHQALDTLSQLATALRRRYPDLSITFDLAELRGYHYHTGVVFTAYVPGQGQEVARGGRYDNIGRVFGHARPATGFSTDLRALLALTGPAPAPADAIYAPAVDDPELDMLVRALRARGERVIRALPGADPGPRALACDRVLIKHQGAWQVASASA